LGVSVIGFSTLRSTGFCWA